MNTNTNNLFRIFGSFDSELHAGKYFIYLYNELFNTYAIYVNIELENFLKELNAKFSLTNENYIVKDEQSRNNRIEKIDYNSSSYFIKIKDKLLFFVNAYKAEFWYGKDIDRKEIDSIIEMLHVAKKRKKHKRKFYMVAASGRTEYGFEFRKFSIKKIDLNLSENYNDDFLPVHNIIFDFLKDSTRNGLVLLHGKHGTGKTTYIRHIMNNINKRFIFLPLNLMEAINAPNFLPFISKYKDSILVLEDCEELLLPRNSGNANTNSLVNLLNLGDGLLSDALSFKIICTFNANLKQIDQAILRKGRLVARYEFNDLEIEKVKRIYEKLGIAENPAKPMNLAEIFNKQAADFSVESFTKKVGF